MPGVSVMLRRSPQHLGVRASRPPLADVLFTAGRRDACTANAWSPSDHA